jgi:hypothetical protein
MKRNVPLRRGPWKRAGAKDLRRKRWVKARNAERRAKEFARCYGSETRVLWVQSLACVGCGATPSQNAHTIGGGGSRKANADTIAPLCAECHRRYDHYRPPFDVPERREAIRLHAAFTAARWEHMGETT